MSQERNQPLSYNKWKWAHYMEKPELAGKSVFRLKYIAQQSSGI